MIFVYATFPTQVEAKKISTALINSKLVACANILPITSIFPWEGRITTVQEYAVWLKTEKKLYRRVAAFIRQRHSYEVPCILQVPIERIDASYRRWLHSHLSTK